MRGFYRALVSRRAGVVTLAGDVEDIERRAGEERDRIEAEYREVLKSSVAFEEKSRNRCREKNLELPRGGGQFSLTPPQPPPL